MKVDSSVSEAYGNGESERIIGRLIKEGTSEENKARLYITTKCTSIAIINAPEPLANTFCTCSPPFPHQKWLFPLQSPSRRASKGVFREIGT